MKTYAVSSASNTFLIKELSVSFLQKNTEFLMTIFHCAAAQFGLKPSTGPSDSTREI